MPGKVIGVSLGNGFPGAQSRTADAIIQARVAADDIKFGSAVVLTSSNQWDNVESTTSATDIAGVAVREVVQANTFDPQSNPDYVEGAICDVMTRGNCIVKCQRGTPVSGAAVYVRVAENESYSDCVVGGFEASSDSTNSVEVSNIEWTTGVIDDNGYTEITIKSRAKA